MERDTEIEFDIFTASSIGDLDFLLHKISPENLNRFNFGKWSALMYASYYDHPNVVGFLLNAGANPNAGIKTALMLAATCGHDNVIKVLFNLGNAKLNVQDENGWSALHYACSSGHYNSVQLLVSIGSKLDIKTKDQLTPFLLSVQCGHERIIELLLQSGADPNVTACGKTASQVALENGNERLAPILINIASPSVPEILDQLVSLVINVCYFTNLALSVKAFVCFDYKQQGPSKGRIASTNMYSESKQIYFSWYSERE